MKRHWIGLCGLGLLVSAALAQERFKPAEKPTAQEQKTEEQQPTLETTRDKVSYGFGMSFGLNLKRQKFDLDPKLLAKGLSDALAGRESLVSEEDLQAAFAEFQTEQAERLKQLAADNKKKGQEFLAANAKKKGVQTLKSGLQYLVIQEGTGETPTKNSNVKTHYRGTLLDGTEFDSSYAAGEPAVFGVSQVIKGWTEALQLMKVGAKWKLFIPSDLAYEERGHGPIGPNETLIFEIELLGIEE